MNCWWHQWKISRAADDGDLLSAGTQRHLARCPKCRAFARQVQSMDRLLSEGAPPLARIQHQSSRSLYVRRFAAAVAAAIIIAAGITAHFAIRPGSERLHMPVDRSLASLVNESANAVQSPMQRQMQLVASNVSSAAKILIPPWPTPAQSPDSTATP